MQRQFQFRRIIGKFCGFVNFFELSNGHSRRNPEKYFLRSARPEVLAITGSSCNQSSRKNYKPSPLHKSNPSSTHRKTWKIKMRKLSARLPVKPSVDDFCFSLVFPSICLSRQKSCCECEFAPFAINQLDRKPSR